MIGRYDNVHNIGLRYEDDEDHFIFLLVHH